ncbi:MAG: ATP-dependent protease, partial [Alcaligenaceae bacterium]|nr:ATP-dependent protease [Alcaligenaceae bacterium]
TIRQRVQRCQQRQYQRQGMLNASLQGEALDRYAALQPEALQLMENAMRKWAWSVRVVQRLRRVARTIADMQQSEHITAEHVALAMQFRDQSGLKY